MDFSLSDEQQLIVKSTHDFVVNELYPHEREVEETGVLREDLHRELKAKAIDAGLYGANMPVDVGGAGLDTVAWVLYEKELGRTNYALHYSCVGRPSNILLACEGEQRERYLLPTVRGERTECLAMTEPGAGSDVKGIRTTARRPPAIARTSPAGRRRERKCRNPAGRRAMRSTPMTSSSPRWVIP